MLYTFVPMGGRLKGQTYRLPLSKSDSRSNNRTSTLVGAAASDGEYDNAGTAPMPMTSGTFTVTFTFWPGWYKQLVNGNRDYYNGTNDDIVGRENALLHFAVAVLEGGEGLLTDGYSFQGHTGIVDPVTGAPISYYQADAKLSANSGFNRMSGSATIDITWAIQSAYWITSTGQRVPFF